MQFLDPYDFNNISLNLDWSSTFKLREIHLYCDFLIDENTMVGHIHKVKAQQKCVSEEWEIGVG